jgi:hypothetical protein
VGKKMDENKVQVKSKMQQMERKMNENKEQMGKKMEELKNSMATIFLHLDERLPKGDTGNIENKDNNIVEPQLHMGNILKNVENMSMDSHNHDYSSLKGPYHRGFNSTPRNYFIPKIDTRKFDGKNPITWIFQMEQLFDLHQVSSLQKVAIASLNLENDQFV